MFRRQARQFDAAELRVAPDEAGAEGAPARVSTRTRDECEGDRDDSWELGLRVWPAPARLVARLDFHGSRLERLG